MVWPYKQNALGKDSQTSFIYESKKEKSSGTRLGLQPSEMLEVVADRDVWLLNLELLSSQPSRT